MSNTRIMLDQKFKEEKANLPSHLDLGQQFEIFCADIVHRDLGWSFSEIQQGVVGGGQDGGVDAIYLLINGSLISEETDFVPINSGIEIHLIIMQMKHEDKVSEAVIDRLYQHIDWILALEPDAEELEMHLNSDIRAKLDLFKGAIRRYATKSHTISIDIHYCNRGDEPTKEAQSLAAKLEKKCLGHFPAAKVSFEFLGVEKLFGLATKAPEITRTLAPIGGGIITAPNNSYVALVELKNYVEFIVDGDSLIQSLFEFNVRDYEGDRKAVNASMAETIAAFTETEDFWWFNNGVTIICSQITPQSQKLVIKNPMIVNGLQTSNVLYENRALIRDNADDKRALLLRIVQLEDPDIQERVIMATNSQTSLKPLALKATDSSQKKIEEFLRGQNIYYERRKNFYKNRGKSASQIIDVARLGQAVMAMRMQVPHESRGRPGSYLKKPANYDKVFPDSIDYSEYVVAAKAERQVDAFLSSVRKQYDALHRNNLRFHILMVLVWALSDKKTGKIAKLPIHKADTKQIQKVFDWIVQEFDDEGPEDSTAKDKSFTKRLKDNWTVQDTKV